MIPKSPRIPLKEMLLVGFLPSFLKVLIYRIRGARIGSNVSIGPGAVLIGKDISIGSNTQIGMLTIIRAKKIKIGRYVKIGATTVIDTERIEIDDDAKINEQVFIGGLSSPESSLKVGKRATIMQMSFLNTMKPISIGENSGIGGHCLLFTHGSWLSQLKGYPVTFEPITIGNNVWLPWRVFIMPGVTIGDNAVIGANSLVSKNIPPNSLAAGSPAKILKENYPSSLSEEERRSTLVSFFNDFMEYLAYNALKIDTLEDSENRKHWTFSKGSKKFELVFIKDGKSDFIKPLHADNILVLDSEKGMQELSHESFAMTVNLYTEERIGTSKVGEEFASFIARYGIRFNRLD